MQMQKNKVDLIYGIHPIVELLRAKKRKIYDLFVDKSRQKNISEIIHQLPSYTKVFYCDKKKLDLLCGSPDHQSVAAYVSPFLYQKNFFKSTQFPVLLFCDSIQDTKNLGALFRSAYCTNILGVVITEEASVGITASVFKSSAGLAEHIFIYKSKNIKLALEEAVKNGYVVYLAAANGLSLDKVKIVSPCVIVIGNEHVGIDSGLYKFGTVISLRQKENCISYNASVAGGILLYNISSKLLLI
jgi:23S rRNA (guanosine2251-2'-O)-methyltransferase